MPTCYDTNEAVITLGSYDFAANGRDLPLVSRSYEYMRPDPQGPAFRKVTITLTGFFLGGDHATVMTQFNELQAVLLASNLSFTYKASASVVIENARAVYTDGLSIPEDWNQYDGTYTIKLYYHDSATIGIDLACTFVSANSFDFGTRPPVWSRSIQQNRPSHRSAIQGSTATITLSGMLFATSSSALQALITSLEAAFILGGDGLLTYGGFTQACKVVRCQCGPAVTVNYAPYSIELRYDIGSMVALSKRIQFTRIHNNPIIKEKPFCNTRSVREMSQSGQSVTYSLYVEAADIATCRSLLSAELTAIVIAGGIEMPGGTEIWDYDKVSVTINLTKFYTIPIMLNLGGI